MNGIMNENQLTVEYQFDNTFIQKIDSVIDSSLRDCHKIYFPTFDHICVYDINFTNITNNETVNFTISDKSMHLYELNNKLSVARENGFVFNQVNNFKTKIYSNLAHINIHYNLKLRIPIMHRHFFKKLAQNPENIQTHCTDRRNPFHFACHEWYLYNNPQC